MADNRFFNGPHVHNIGISYSSPNFTIEGADGRALSASNPGVIVVPSQSSLGDFVRFNITSNQFFIDDTGASEIIGNTFGTTAGVAWANPLPFFLYAVPNDAETVVSFMISRYPHLKQSPAAAAIGDPGSPIADAEASMWALDNITQTSFESNPCVAIGSFRMVKSTLDDWTVQTLDSQDSIGSFNDDRFFTFPLGQNGGATGTYFSDNGGTAPIFTTNQYSFKIARNGRCTIFTNIRGDGGLDGAGAVLSLMAVPYVSIDTDAAVNNQGIAQVNSAGTGFIFTIVNFLIGSTLTSFATDAGSNIVNSNFSKGGRDILFAGTYDMQAF